MRLLLIEDDESLCLSLSYQLRQDGFAPETCHDGEEGLLWARQQGYDLILLDRMLPGMDGLTLLRQLRREGIHTPVIFLTALGQLSDKTGGLDAGADDYIVKPFAYDELLARIRCVLRRPAVLSGGVLLRYGDVTYDPGRPFCCGYGEWRQRWRTAIWITIPISSGAACARLEVPCV